MHGDGTKTAITTSNPPARLLELTRVLGVAGARPSGVDRVCLAYLKAVVEAPEPSFGLARTRLGFVLIDNDGMRGLLLRLEQRVPWGTPDLLSKLLRKSKDFRQITESDLRRLSIARCTPARLGRMLQRNVPPGTVYLNVDQANFSQTTLAAIKTVPHAQVSIFLHDAIPLDYPEYQTPQSIERFRGYLSATQMYADMILTNSDVSKDAIERHLDRTRRTPSIEVAHLGVDTDFFQSVNNPVMPNIPGPYFVCIGTIEPRKNHVLLLDVWDRMAKSLPMDDMPHLVICGRRGWMVDDLTARLDASPLKGAFVHEFNDLDDDALFSMLRDAAGLVFPSLAEGYGLPPAEAAAMGVPVICSDLPVLREILSDYPIYAGVSDSYSWEKAIRSLAKAHRANKKPDGQTGKRYSPATWEAHFNTVLKVT
ncbi:glycosyltransferase family 1 protein [Shimia sp.]|uniref:glycosyltransferase family 4 protein n=1 Tax=Shimia sp. TaxID=1954381 RepID=UPI003298B6F5